MGRLKRNKELRRQIELEKLNGYSCLLRVITRYRNSPHLAYKARTYLENKIRKTEDKNTLEAKLLKKRLNILNRILNIIE